LQILVVSQYFWPENFRVNDLVQELVQRGHRVTVLTGIPNYPAGQVFEGYLKNPAAYFEYEGARIVRVPMLPRGSGGLRLILNYISFVFGGCVWGPWHLRNFSPDVIFVFEPSPVTVGLPAVLLSSIKRAPVVFWALDLWPDTLSALGVVRAPGLLKAVGRLVKFIYNRCTLILGQSRGALASLASMCADQRKIRYFPSWAETVFTETVVAPAAEVPLRKDLFNILFAGNIGEAQDMPAVLDAAEKLKNYHHIRWLVVGDGRKLAWVRGELERRGLEERVLLLGRFPVERMPSFYAHADALLVSLKRDPVFGLTIPGKVQSYLMAGIPLIGMLDGEGAHVIQSAQAGISCAAGDSDGLAQAVLTMATLGVEERHRLGQNGQHYARLEFDRARLMDQLESFLKEAVETRAWRVKNEVI
jgi:glycosyltransferase involved in cell wall biosynthesis